MSLAIQTVILFVRTFRYKNPFSIPAKSGTQRKGGKVKHFYRQKEFNNGVIVRCIFKHLKYQILQITDETDTDRRTPICVGNWIVSMYYVIFWLI